MKFIIPYLAVFALAGVSGYVVKNINRPDTPQGQPAAANNIPDKEISNIDEKMSSEQKNDKVVKTDAQWRQELTGLQYKVLRQKATEKPFTGKYDKFDGQGVYVCAGCGNVLFTSDTKFESHCGWPSFYRPAEQAGVEESVDTSHSMLRTEITCSKCGGHLGHVFNDGPAPTGLRYCINSAALKFEPPKESEEK